MKRLLTLALAVAAVAAFALRAHGHPPHPAFVPPPPVVVEHPPVIVAPAPPVCPVYALDTFARDFRPVEGHHKILVIHPVTKCPVEVCFDLPCGKLKEFEVNRRSVEFDYGRHKVRLVFRLNGKVDVQKS